MLEVNNTTKQKINLRQLHKLAELFLKVHKKPSALVSLAIVGPTKMRQLNKIYRGLDKTTDVLSFIAHSSQPTSLNRDKYLGEVIININESQKISKYRAMLLELGVDLGRSQIAVRNYIFNFLFVHGLLHLLAYNDEKEKDRLQMLGLGKKFLEKAEKML